MGYTSDNPKRVVLGGMCVTKEMKEDGTVTYRESTIGDLHPMELLGMVVSAQDTLRAQLMSGAKPLGATDD